MTTDYSSEVVALSLQWREEVLATHSTYEKLCTQILEEFPIKVWTILKGRTGPLLVASIFAKAELDWRSPKENHPSITVRGTVRKKTKDGWHSVANDVYDFQDYRLYEENDAPTPKI